MEFLVNISTSETGALVNKSVDLNIVCPTRLDGSFPEMSSDTTTFFLLNLADDGLIRYFSRSKTRASSPYKTLNRTFTDSSTPLDW